MNFYSKINIEWRSVTLKVIIKYLNYSESSLMLFTLIVWLDRRFL